MLAELVRLIGIGQHPASTGKYRVECKCARLTDGTDTPPSVYCLTFTGHILTVNNFIQRLLGFLPALPVFPLRTSVLIKL